MNVLKLPELTCSVSISGPHFNEWGFLKTKPMREFLIEIKETTIKEWLIMGSSALIGGTILAALAISMLF